MRERCTYRVRTRHRPQGSTVHDVYTMELEYHEARDGSGKILLLVFYREGAGPVRFLSDSVISYEALGASAPKVGGDQ